MNITIFTPTYNRGYIIGKLYESLLRQTNKDFEWLVIDDGSSDNTEDLFSAWRNNTDAFPIRYFKVPNGGKHRAVNRGTELARGKLFFIVDSDDDLPENAVASIIEWEQSIADLSGFCGVAGSKGKQGSGIWGTTFEGDYIDATSLERKQWNITGDKAEVFYTRILRNYKFDEIEGETFITEATVWNRMAYDGYKIRWFNQTIYHCEYLEDGLTANQRNIFARNPEGTARYIKQQMEYYDCDLRGRLSYYNLYYSFVKDRFNLIRAAKYLEINAVTLALAVYLVKFRNALNTFRNRVKQDSA